MYTYVARQPIFDAENKVIAYELLYRDGDKNCFPNIDSNEATSKIIAQNHLMSGFESIVQDKMAFINFSEDTILHHFPTSIDPEQVYIEVLETVNITPELVKACQELHRLGYRLAFDDFDFDSKWDPLLPYISMIKVDVQQFSIIQISKNIRQLEGSGIILLAEKVETETEFVRLRHLGFQYFQGYYFARPEMFKQKNIAPSKQNLLQLMAESAKPHLDLEVVSTIIERDVSLSYKLLRFINSSAFAKRQEIASLKHALSYMGEVEVKKFISLIALAKLAEDKNPELTNMAIIRAKFCSNLSAYKNESQNPPSAFLTGLFSLIDVMLDMELGLALEKLPVQEQIKLALTDKVGSLGGYLELIRAFEQANWVQVDNLSKQLAVPNQCILTAYTEAIQWANSFENIQ
ncbi:EAL and HDOD domain-containing protein [Shewanella gelidii]|uniref:Histidine kinase n=1 Tax=Shewanella gelidii TaxID=1642821 RepID=A0A917N8D9_9GAMM|nr:HDOD domain-containing protein [Shewanella gelidii]MCL1099259.1 HDOD domain-containing protein [Shewanella gelidii]GGI76794.1 histidine kinase [Shewanella gelidii]